MKLLAAIFIFYLFSQVIGRSVNGGFEDISESCLRETGQDLNSVLMDEWGLFPEDDSDMLNLFGCVYLKANVVSTDNKVDKDGLFHFLFAMLDIPGPEGIGLVQDMTDTCQDFYADDNQLTSLRIQNCINEYMNTLIWYNRNLK